MCFQRGARADINILMGAAFTFIKEGSRHISAGAEDGTLRGNEWRSNAAGAGVCELSRRLHVNQRRPDVSQSLRGTCDLQPRFADVASSLFRFKHCQCLCWHLSLSSVSLLSLSRLPVFIQVFIRLLQAAYRLLYYSWAPYCSLAAAGCLFSLLYHLQPPWQSLIHNLTGLNFRITVGYCIHYSCLLQFPFILEVDYNQINTWAVGNAAGNKPELGLWQWQLPYLDFHLYFTCIIHQLTQIDLDFVAG